MQSYTDDQLLTALKAGCERAFTELFNRHKQMVYLEAYYQLKDTAEAQDIVQEIFTWLWDKHHKIPDDKSLKGYLFRATRNKCIDKHRKAKRIQHFNQAYPHIKESSINPAPLEAKELRLQLSSAINTISAPASRRAFELLYLEGKSHKIIASEMNTEVQTVKNQISRALKVLRDGLKNLGRIECAGW